MRRRRFVRGAGVAALGVTAGCTDGPPSTDEGTPLDEDGDGVPDERDYAPSDPAMQRRSDVVTATRSSTATPGPSPPSSAATSSSAATPSPPPTATPLPPSTSTRSTTIRGDTGPLEGRAHHVEQYSLDRATVRVYADLLDGSFPNGADLSAVVAGYPGTSRSGHVYASHRSDSFTPPRRGDAAVTVTFDGRPAPDVPFYYRFALVPSDADDASIDADEAEYLCQTDRLSLRHGDLTRSPHPAEPGDDDSARYTRRSAEGCYVLDFSGSSYSHTWNAAFTVSKHGYVEDRNGRRYADRRYYVYEALDDGFADEFGRILHDEAEANGITGDRRTVEFLIDFVQNLPYVPDDVGTGYDDYTKRHAETLVDGGGDCEDSSLMLASLLLSDSFGYGTALLLLPGHAALGVKGGDDVDGYYYEADGSKYFYVETTGRGWDVGEIPDEYRNEDARVRVL